MKKTSPSNILVFVKRVGRPAFTTHELVTLSGRSASNVTQCLRRLVQQGQVIAGSVKYSPDYLVAILMTYLIVISIRSQVVSAEE